MIVEFRSRSEIERIDRRCSLVEDMVDERRTRADILHALSDFDKRWEKMVLIERFVKSIDKLATVRAIR